MRETPAPVMLHDISEFTLTMDELDRLYRRLVHNVRAAAPELLGRPFEVSRVYQQLVPYRTNRRELAFDANDEYELALCQLLSGTRGYLDGEYEMQRALRKELESANPDLASYRAFATAMVSFSPEPLKDVMLRPSGETTPTKDVGIHRSPIEQAVMAGRPTEEFETPVDLEGVSEESTHSSPSAPPVAQATTSSVPIAKTTPLPSAMPATRPSPIRVVIGDACRYCATKLPEGRSIVFCPGCGHNLTIKHCPACNTELEVGWKFCVTCGRETSEA